MFDKETMYESTDYQTKTIEVITIKEDKDKQEQGEKPKDGMPDKLVEIHYPPDLLYETVEAHFVTKILTPPPDKMDIMNYKWIIIIGAGILIWWYLNGGKLF